MARFEPAPGLDEEIARRLLAPQVGRLSRAVMMAARRRAPAGKRWQSVGDERVRHSHRAANGQTAPDNLRYYLPKVNTGNDVNDIRVGYDLARYPRDPELPIGNRIHCRCSSLPVPGWISSRIWAQDVVVAGARVRAQVTCDAPRCVGAEVGEHGDPGAHFMTGALREIAGRGA